MKSKVNSHKSRPRRSTKEVDRIWMILERYMPLTSLEIGESFWISRSRSEKLLILCKFLQEIFKSYSVFSQFEHKWNELVGELDALTIQEQKGHITHPLRKRSRIGALVNLLSSRALALFVSNEGNTLDWYDGYAREAKQKGIKPIPYNDFNDFFRLLGIRVKSLIEEFVRGITEK